MQTRQPNPPADYFDLAADMDGIRRELQDTVRGAWLRGAVTATLALGAGVGLAAWLLGLIP